MKIERQARGRFDPEEILAAAQQCTAPMMRMEDSSLRQVSRIANFLMKIKQGARTQRDVKNEGCSQDLIENKGREYTNSHNANILMKLNSLSFMPICY